jgi:hypothetical protein
MQATTDKLRGGTSALEASERQLHETIDVAAGTMTELQRNRETITRVRGNVSNLRCMPSGIPSGIHAGRHADAAGGCAGGCASS